MTEEGVKLEGRLTAIEYMIGHTLSSLLLVLGASDEQLDPMERNAKVTFGQTTFPGADPAMGDLLASEIQENIERLIQITHELRSETLRKIGASK